ncbi:hypothetical protein B566_EDAN014567 [Ephemera danica]|nr:hypothetical protein B566_EDAN014567 [Ephemera danica]
MFHRSVTIRINVHTTGTASVVAQWCLRVLGTAGELALPVAMSSLELLLRGRAVTADPHLLTQLLNENGDSSVVAWLRQEQLATLRILSPAEVELAALRVVKAIASPTEPGGGAGVGGGNSMPPARIRRLEACASIFTAKLSAPVIKPDIHYFKRMAVCLKGMQAVALQRPSLLTLPVGLGIVRGYWLVGLPEHAISSHPPTPAEPGPPPPSTTAVKSGARRGRGGGAKHVKKVRSSLTKDTTEEDDMPVRGRNRTLETEDESVLWFSDSDDPSDTEAAAANTGKEIQAILSAVRFASLRLLLLLIKTGDQQALMSFWDSLLPYTSPGSPPPSTPSILCCLLRDPHVCSRTAAAQCVAEMLQRCQPFLALAEASSTGSLAFTPWSHSLALSLESCQRCLTLALGSERVAQCLVTTLGALASLAAVTPYHRLQPGLINRLARCTRPQLFHKTALAVFGSLVNCNAATQELAELRQLLQRPQPSSLLGSLSSKPQTMVSDTEEEQVEAPEFEEEEDEVVKEQTAGVGRTWLVEYCLDSLKLTERTRRFRLEPCRVLAGISRSCLWLLLGESGTVLVRASAILASTMLEEEDQNIQMTAGRALVDLGQALGEHLQQPDALGCLRAVLEMWDSLLSKTVPQLTASSSAPLRALACDILAAMGPTVYENLPREQRLLVGFHLFALSRDAMLNVRTPAVRALGVCVNWPAVMEDGQFVLDAAEEKGFPETVPEPLLLKMLESSLHACKDDKLRRPECRELVGQAVAALMECASSPKPSLMKVRWNACHSLACVMRGKHFCEENLLWQGQVFPMLCELVVNSPNFKVRISAAVALAAPSVRQHYGNFFLPACSALLEALASADNVHDFREFQHRDNLVDQICLSLSHLMSCLTEEDLSGGVSGPLLQLVMSYEAQLQAQLLRVRLRLVPERTKPLSQATEHLGSLADSCKSPAHRDAAVQLSQVLSADDSMNI